MLTPEEVRRLVNQIIDPCSAARGVPIGLVDMGLLGEVNVLTEVDGGCGVEATMFVTGPSCLMSLEFESRARSLLEEAGAAWVRIRWDSDHVWTQDSIDPRARERLLQRRSQLLTAARRPPVSAEP